ncbi:arylamine N-acetyltransferase family protein [Streptomonospora arabica]|uniref:Arylamine N-acetyltransferase n=1 Tax=Streptomonospora arabica TaxID=412417 RepID=A0ABV9SEH3_9ACTN
MSIDAILERIGHRAPLRSDAETLHRLHAAWRHAVPYENIDIQLGRTISLDPAVLLAKFGPRRRGGTCFEANCALALLLRGAGFAVTLHEAAVRPWSGGDPEWGNHVALLVRTREGDWLADAGIADGFVDPLPLREGRHVQGPVTYRLKRVDADTWRWHHHPRGSVASYDLRTAEREPADFARRAAVRPAESGLERLLLAFRLRGERELTLRARTVTESTRDGTRLQRRVLGDRDAFRAALAGDFGVPLSDLGPDGVEALWRRSGEQHGRHLAREGA